MKIVVTGATGLLGNATAKHLIAKGHEVVPVDRRDGEVAPGVKVIVGDLSSLEFCDSVMVGAEAVIHLAAIPNPTDKRQHEVFSNNVVSSFAVFSAAAHAGVRIVAYASSLSAYGFPYSESWTSPKYVPVDEDHPLEYEESYALSKEVNELSAQMWFSRTGISFVGMRFPWTNLPDKTYELAARSKNEDTLPPDPRFPKGIVAKVLWCYLDLRDAAAALEAVVMSDFKGSDTFNFAAPDTMSDEPTVDLMKKFHPKSEIRGDLSANAAPYSSERFIKRFGYKPQYLLDRAELKKL
uniref:NAD-dependent epimerase/dehydratase family protein n=1 Tax=Candidatus Planktophila sp. TaxID=2175601 RepID=UPI0040494AF7